MRKERVMTELDICDTCALIPYDNGIEGWEEQVSFMAEMGGETDDHMCDAKEEPDLNIQCDCGCRRRI